MVKAALANPTTRLLAALHASRHDDVKVGVQFLSPTTCRAIQQSDEMHCAMCGLRWDVNDSDPPKCARANFGDLDSPAPNHIDHSRRGFSPK